MAEASEHYSASELKRLLASNGVDFSSCIEKDDLLNLAEKTLARFETDN